MADPYSYAAEKLVEQRLQEAAIANARPHFRKRRRAAIPRPSLRLSIPRAVWSPRLGQRPA